MSHVDLISPTQTIFVKKSTVGINFRSLRILFHISRDTKDSAKELISKSFD